MHIRVALDAALEKDLWEIARAAGRTSWIPYEHDQPGNESKATRLEALAQRLDGIRTTYSLGDGEAAKHLAEAQRYMRDRAAMIRTFPQSDGDRGNLAAIPIGVEIRLNRALDAYRGIKELSSETVGRLDRMVEGVRKLADHMRSGESAEALKAIEQLLRGVREFRTELVRQAERGTER